MLSGRVAVGRKVPAARDVPHVSVEEVISRVRGEIEGMEAEQQGLEHRVSYATLDLELAEHDPAPPASASAWSRLADAAQAGGRNATAAVVGLIGFVLEYGLAFVLIAALLLAPAWFLWRRWRKVRARW